METLSQPQHLDLPLPSGCVFGVSSMDVSLETSCRPTGELWAGKGSPCEVPETSKGMGFLEGLTPATVSTIPYELASPPSLQTD